MKFEIFDDGVFQPIEFILATIYILIAFFIVFGMIDILDATPWLGDKLEVSRWWVTTLTIFWCYHMFGFGKK